MSLAREIEALTQSIKIIYEKFKVPALEKEEEENEQLSAEVFLEILWFGYIILCCRLRD